MKRLPLLAFAPLVLASCSGVGSSELHQETDWVRARWDRPREAPGGSELPWLEVEREDDAGELTVRLLAFEDADLDAQPDSGRPQLESTWRLGPGEDALRVEGEYVDGAPPIRWVLLLESGERTARFELGVGPFGTVRKRF